MTPEARKIKGADARALLENRLLKEAFANVAAYIEGEAMSCKPDDMVRAQRIILSKQLLAAIQRELTRAVEDGAVAEIQIHEIEKARGLRRFIR